MNYLDNGDKTLNILSEMSSFSDWLYSQIKPYLKGHILEIGSGLGTYSYKIIRDFSENRITLSDIDKNYVANLKKKFGESTRISIVPIDFGSTDDFLNMKESFDSIFALNVLEHVRADDQALRNIFNALRSGGTAIILVPAHKILFNSLDKNLDRYRRYDSLEFNQKIISSGLKIKKMFYFNSISIPGWFIMGNILKRKTIPETTPRFLEPIIPTISFIEKNIFKGHVGISLIAIATKE